MIGTPTGVILKAHLKLTIIEKDYSINSSYKSRESQKSKKTTKSRKSNISNYVEKMIGLVRYRSDEDDKETFFDIFDKKFLDFFK